MHRLPTGVVDEVARSGEGQAAVRARLVGALRTATTEKGMTQVQAARLLGTDQPTLSKVLRGRTESVSLDKLVAWLMTLGCSIEIRVYEPSSSTSPPSFTATIPGAVDA